jgi:hypothetical protein
MLRSHNPMAPTAAMTDRSNGYVYRLLLWRVLLFPTTLNFWRRSLFTRQPLKRSTWLSYLWCVLRSASGAAVQVFTVAFVYEFGLRK